MNAARISLRALALAAVLASACSQQHQAMRKEKSSCPEAFGATMARVERFCIDRTEVTRGQYAAWLAKQPAATGQPAECAWNTDFTPRCEWPPSAETDGQPVVCVDWCDAAAFCRAAGKRLCGRVEGGPNPFDAWRTPSSEWYAACTRNSGERDGARCVGWKKGLRKPDRVMSQSRCTTSDGVADLIGNVWEWEDSCAGTGGAKDRCRVRGGSFMSADEYLTCDQPGDQAREASTDDIGFRCCAP